MKMQALSLIQDTHLNYNPSDFIPTQGENMNLQSNALILSFQEGLFTHDCITCANSMTPGTVVE